MAKLYYSLVVRDDTIWGVQFGDYDYLSVEDERDDYAAKGYRRSDLCIIVTDGDQASIDAAVASMNGG